MQMWSQTRARILLHNSHNFSSTLQGGGPAATAAAASLYVESCPPQTPPRSPPLLAASAALPPDLPMPQPIAKKGAGSGQSMYTAAGKGAGKGGKGGKGMGAGRGGHEIPPPASMTPSERPKTTFPANGLGRVDGKPWNDETWNAARIDYERIITDNSTGHGCAGTMCEKVLEKAWPKDASCTSMRRELPDKKTGRGPWPKDSCRYCYFRKLPTQFTDASGMWYYGTGDGGHNPWYCKSFVRWLCEGGGEDAKMVAGGSSGPVGNALRACVVCAEPRSG